MKIDRGNPQVQKNWNKLRSFFNDQNVTFYILPNAKLQQIIAKGQHPVSRGMPVNRKAQLLSGSGVVVTSRMVWNFLNGKLDQKQTFILENSDIRVVGYDGSIFGGNNSIIK